MTREEALAMLGGVAGVSSREGVEIYNSTEKRKKYCTGTPRCPVTHSIPRFTPNQ